MSNKTKSQDQKRTVGQESPMILKACNISKSYAHGDGRVEVLRDVDLSVSRGEVLAIVGPSGAGKSTLLHIIGGLDSPSNGVVYIKGEEIYKLNDRDLSGFRNRNIGFVFQFYHLLPEFTAMENVLLPLMVKEKKGSPKRFLKEAEDILGQVGLSHRLTHKPSELSGGEQQRVAIARALINQPEIIFCDEPTGNLNTESGQEIIDLLLDLNKKNHQTFVIVTHDEEVAKRADRIVYMKDGILDAQRN